MAPQIPIFTKLCSKKELAIVIAAPPLELLPLLMADCATEVSAVLFNTAKSEYAANMKPRITEAIRRFAEK